MYFEWYVVGVLHRNSTPDCVVDKSQITGDRVPSSNASRALCAADTEETSGERHTLQLGNLQERTDTDSDDQVIGRWIGQRTTWDKAEENEKSKGLKKVQPLIFKSHEKS